MEVRLDVEVGEGVETPLSMVQAVGWIVLSDKLPFGKKRMYLPM